ncbi:MAG: hypothetical protein BWY71_01998 [Planctomycetes bacterium ADurb.Bin412]|nr:MAG: hypothetical protein BWY71_01998 [Planctomycetes bacterium ADurb.Bin412]
MGRIHNHRQMRIVFRQRNRADIQRKTHFRFKAPAPPLAQDHLIIAFAENILRTHQPVLHRIAGPPLQQHRLLRLADLRQQHKILHIPRPHLQHVRIPAHHFHVPRIGHFCNHRQPEPVAAFPQNLQTLLPQSLKTVRAGPRLERPAPQHIGSALLGRLRQLQAALPALHCTRSGDQSIMPPPDSHRPHLHHRTLRVKIPAGQLIRLHNRQYIFHPLDAQQLVRKDRLLFPDRPDNRPELPLRYMRTQPQLLDSSYDLLRHFLRGSGTQYNQHRLSFSHSTALQSPGENCPVCSTANNVFSHRR